LYVINQSDATLYIYDTHTLTRIDSIDTRVSLPHYIEFAPDEQNYYITTLELPTGHIAKIDALTNLFVDSVSVSPGVVPSAIAVTADSKYGYVCNFSSPSQRTFIHKYDLSTMQYVTALQAGAMTHDIKITSDGSVVVACNMTSDDVTLVYAGPDTVTFVPLDTMNIGGNEYSPYGVVIDHKDSLAYIACMDKMMVKVLDIAARQFVDSVEIPVMGSDPVAGPSLMAVSPNDQVVFVTTQGGNSVVAFSTATGAILADIYFSTPYPFGITMTDDGSRVYVACVGTSISNGRVYVIDGNTFAIVDSLEVGIQSFGLVWHRVIP
jgi:DNA-binding beta-propeller fold protein YncE